MCSVSRTDLQVLEEWCLVDPLVPWADLLVAFRNARAIHILFRRVHFHIHVHVLFQRVCCVAGSFVPVVGTEIVTVAVAHTVAAAQVGASQRTMVRLASHCTPYAVGLVGMADVLVRTVFAGTVLYEDMSLWGNVTKNVMAQ